MVMAKFASWLFSAGGIAIGLYSYEWVYAPIHAKSECFIVIYISVLGLAKIFRKITMHEITRDVVGTSLIKPRTDYEKSVVEKMERVGMKFSISDQKSVKFAMFVDFFVIKILSFIVYFSIFCYSLSVYGLITPKGNPSLSDVLIYVFSLINIGNRREPIFVGGNWEIVSTIFSLVMFIWVVVIVGSSTGAVSVAIDDEAALEAQTTTAQALNNKESAAMNETLHTEDKISTDLSDSKSNKDNIRP